MPTVTAISPNDGPQAGGTEITISGTGFTQASLVSFGDIAASSFTVLSDTSIRATTPKCCSNLGSSGQDGVDVTVTSPGGTSVADAPYDLYIARPVPSIVQISPSSGPQSGGTVITIVGSGLSGASEVDFGSVVAPDVTVVSDTEVKATTPKCCANLGSSGQDGVEVRLKTAGGTSPSSSGDGFTFYPQPAVTALAPATGHDTGGTTVTITGSGFTGATEVDFGGTPATSLVVNSDSSITAVTPQLQIHRPTYSGTTDLDVSVITPGGTSPISQADAFAVTKPTSITITPVDTSAAVVGAHINLHATGNFSDGTSADLSNLVTWSSGTPGVATVDATGRTTEVSVGTTTITGAYDDVSGSTALTVVAVPAVTAISPSAGSTAGGTTLTITGSGFGGATSIVFQWASTHHFSIPASNFKVNPGDTQITFTLPPLAPGDCAASCAGDFTVIGPGGTSATTPADQFTYVVAPSVTGISPNSGPSAGGTTVTITGTGFAGATGVTLGQTPVTNFVVTSPTTMTVHTPPGTPLSTVDFTVTNAGGTSTTALVDRFTYGPGPTVTRVSPSTGGTAGGTTVTLTGTLFTGASAVKFGSVSAASFTVVSATSITAVAPAGSPGNVAVTVVTPSGTSAPSAVSSYTYFAPVPVVSSLSVNGGIAGTVVTITGNGFTGATTVNFGATPAATITGKFQHVHHRGRTRGHPQISSQVTVTGPGGTSNLISTDVFTYGPLVSSVAPNSGTHIGGTRVTINGAGFSGATTVSFGAVPVTSAIAVNAAGTQITVTAPAHVAGAVDVTVTTPAATTNASALDTFTYF